MRDIKDDYRLNRARLSGSPSPEVSAKLTELDAVRTQDGANTVRGTQAALPSLGGAQGLMNAPMQAMPAAMAPMQAMPAMMGAPMAAFGPLTSALSGLTIPQQVTHNLGEEGSPAELASSLARVPAGPGGVRAAIDEALDIKGITGEHARANWAAGLTTIASRESNFNPEAINTSDINAAHGDPSVGAWQTTHATFAAYHEPGTARDPRDLVAQACAVINYVRGRYGVAADASNFAALVQQADPTRPPKGY
ncbi:transglycosylase SLT domain-containing protein [Mycobacterium intracellulare]|nr:transglycosylase SLT domain-containing protein [Mycobacterium intracellulare]